MHTYTILIKQLDEGKLPKFQNTKVHPRAREYYMMPETATFRDLILSIRADETIHREVNHHFADLEPDADIDKEDIEIVDSEKKVEELQNEFTKK